MANTHGHDMFSVFDSGFNVATTVTDPNGLTTTTRLDVFGFVTRIIPPQVGGFKQAPPICIGRQWGDGP